MEVERSSEENEAQDEAQGVTQKQLDVQDYAQKYEGTGKVARLEFVAEKAASMQHYQLEHEALRLAIEELKNKTLDTETYKRLVHRLGDAEETRWVEQAEMEYKNELKRSEAELEQYRSAAIKESIRQAYDSRASLHWRRGELDEAFKYCAKMRDYCINSHHIILMCMNIIQLSVLLRSFEHVSAHVQKAEQQLSTCTSSSSADALQNQLKFFKALNHIESKRFRKAADVLVQCTTSVAEGTFSMKQIASVDDVASYGLLCAMATFNRSELKTYVTGSSSFRHLLDTRPQLRCIAEGFVNGCFSTTLQKLKAECDRLSYDMFIGAHVHSLFTSTWQRAIQLYAQPYQYVELCEVAEAVNSTVAQVEPELATLIASGCLNARIDAYNSVLKARPFNIRASVIADAHAACKTYHEELPSALMRASLLQNNAIVRRKSVSNSSQSHHRRSVEKRGSTVAVDNESDDDAQ